MNNQINNKIITIEYDLDKKIFEEQRHAAIFSLLNQHLTRREFTVLRARYFKQWTYRQISDYFGFKSTERSRQICAKALRKCRHPKVANILKSYLIY